MTNYLPFFLAAGAFLAPPLAGAAFSGEAAFADLPPAVPFLPLAAGLVLVVPVSTGGLAAASLSGAGFGVS